jgi:hypothetical protein
MTSMWRPSTSKSSKPTKRPKPTSSRLHLCV